MNRRHVWGMACLVSVGLLFSAALDDPRSPGTIRMAQRLQAIFNAQDWKSDPNKQAERIAYYRAGLQGKLDQKTELIGRLTLAQMLLQNGSSTAAVSELEGIRTLAISRGIKLDSDYDGQLRRTLAIAYLREGEQRNCVGNHNADSCVYPFREGAVHKDLAGAEGAIREWTALVEADPTDMTSRWLLNIGYMAAGRETPSQWRIPNVLRAEYPIGRFVDVAPQSGASLTRHAGGVVAEDFDGDGLFDLVVSSSGPHDQLRYLHNNGDGTFRDQTTEAGLEGEVGGLNVIHADYDNDGRPDVLVLRGGWLGRNGNYPFSLLHNNGPNTHGQITFSDVTEQAGMISLHPTQTAAWADFDNDGWLDLFVGHESTRGEAHRSELWHNNKDGTFTDVARQAGLADVGFVKGVAWGDYNNDGRPDLYLSRDGQANLLFRNDGQDARYFWKFSDVTSFAGVGQPIYSFATWFFDYDNDGLLDLLVAGYEPERLSELPAFHLGLSNKQETPHLFRNLGDGRFRDVSKEVGVTESFSVWARGSEIWTTMDGWTVTSAQVHRNTKRSCRIGCSGTIVAAVSRTSRSLVALGTSRRVMRSRLLISIVTDSRMSLRCSGERCQATRTGASCCATLATIIIGLI